MMTKPIRKFTFTLGILLAALGVVTLGPKASAATLLSQKEFKIAHCCHAHPYPPYDNYCCHPPSSTVYVAPAPVVGPASVYGTSRRVARRTSRRVSRRH